MCFCIDISFQLSHCRNSISNELEFPQNLMLEEGKDWNSEPSHRKKSSPRKKFHTVWTISLPTLQWTSEWRQWQVSDEGYKKLTKLFSYAHLSSLPKLKPHIRILKRLYGWVEVTFAIVSSSGRITLNKYHFSDFLYYPISFLVYWERVARACALKTPVIISELSAQS